MKSSLVNVLAGPTVLHPRTGRLVGLPRGADGVEGDSATEDVEETGTDDKEKEEFEEDTTSTVSKSDFDKLQASFNAMKVQLSNADRNKSEAQKKLEELERKEKSELENAQADAKKSTEEAEGWREKFTRQALENAFLSGSMRANIVWHNSSLALRALQDEASEPLTVGDDGAVDGMADKIKKLAKEQPFLVNTASDSEEETAGKKQTASGSNVGSGGKKSNNNKLSDEELKARFPALR